MAGLLNKAGKSSSEMKNALDQSQSVWEESMLRSMDSLRDSILTKTAQQICILSNADYEDGKIHLKYWGDILVVDWPSLEMRGPSGKPTSTFDRAMLLYYLHTADGTDMADRWIGFRELPNGGFYNRAFQGYSGDRLARIFGESLEDFIPAATNLGGERLTSLADYAFSFLPLPRIRIAAVLWPGDDEFPTKASVLFDASSSHYLPTDGLALLGSGLVGRLEKSR
jgi:hypothetical protein